MRTHNAQLHAAVSVAGVAAAVAALTASNATLAEMSTEQQKGPSKTPAAIASAAALVASHCIEIAEDMGADHDQILTAVNSAVNARTNGDVMTLTAAAATGTMILIHSYPNITEIGSSMIAFDVCSVLWLKNLRYHF